VVDLQPAGLQPRAHGGLRGGRDAEALRVLAGREEAVVVGARPIEHPRQQRVLAGRVGVGDREADAHGLRRRRRAEQLRLGQVASDVVDEDAVAAVGCLRGGSDGGEDREGGEDLAHGDC
jgi:hypothetical protein